MRHFYTLLVLAALAGTGAWFLLVRKPAAVGDAPETDLAGCAEHGVPEDRCPFCHPELVESQGMCQGHGVPEALCTKCHPELALAFRAEKDWCAEHGVPESQCEICSPGALAKYDPAPASADSLEPGLSELVPAPLEPRATRGPRVDCTKHALRVRFASPEVARMAGLGFEAVKRKEGRRTLDVNAVLDYDRNHYAHLSSRVPGIVREVGKDLGDWVTAGETLAVVDAVEIGTAKADHAKAIQAVATARKMVEGLEAYVDRMNRLEVRLAAAEYLELRELREIARRNLEREEGLLARSATSEKAVLETKSAFLSADAKVRSLEKKLLLFGLPAEVVSALSWDTVESISGRGTTPEEELLAARSDLAQAEADRDAAARRLRVLGLSDEDVRRVVEEGDVSSLLPIVAPFDGEIVERHAVPGEVVDVAHALFDLADTTSLWALLDVDEVDAPLLKKGQEVVLAVDGRPGETFGGELAWVSPQVDPRTRTVKARALFENRYGDLRAHGFGRARISIATPKDLLVIPKSAVQWEGCCNVAFVKLGDALFAPRKLRIAWETETHSVVAAGLAEGEVVVTDGSFLLKTEILKGSIGAGCCEVEPGK